MSLSNKTIKYIKQHCNGDIKGKRVLITGANKGIGFKTAEILVYLGASVIMACRDSKKAAKAKDALLAEYPGADIKIMQLDLADFASIDAFAVNLPDVDVFVNNAGAFCHPGEKTKEGFDLVMGTNYIGVYYLSKKVLPKLKVLGHKVIYINTISIIHKVAKIDYERFNDSKKAYSRSKLCLARFSQYLYKKYKNTNIDIYMIHPGMAKTEIAVHIFKKSDKYIKFVPINTAEQSALSVPWILSNKVPEGSVVGPNILFGGWGYPEVNKKSRRACVGIKPLIKHTEAEIARVLKKRNG